MYRINFFAQNTSFSFTVLTYPVRPFLLKKVFKVYCIFRRMNKHIHVLAIQ